MFHSPLVSNSVAAFEFVIADKGNIVVDNPKNGRSRNKSSAYKNMTTISCAEKMTTAMNYFY